MNLETWTAADAAELQRLTKKAAEFRVKLRDLDDAFCNSTEEFSVFLERNAGRIRDALKPFDARAE